MTGIVVGFAGHAKSGKTSIAEAVSNHARIPLASFGREVERVARTRGLPLDPPDVRRKTLMAVGAQLIAEDLEPFCRRVLNERGWTSGRSLLVEGVRHAAVVHALRRMIAPTSFHLVLVETAAETREARLAREGIVDPGGREALDAHSTERELDSGLRALAELTIDGGRDAEAAAAVVLDSLQRWGWRQE